MVPDCMLQKFKLYKTHELTHPLVRQRIHLIEFDSAPLEISSDATVLKYRLIMTQNLLLQCFELPRMAI